MERRVEIRPFGVRYMCDNCKTGEMLPLAGKEAIAYEGTQVLIRHVCTHCRAVGSFAEKYPTVRYEDLNPDGTVAQPAAAAATGVQLPQGLSDIVKGLSPEMLAQLQKNLTPDVLAQVQKLLNSGAQPAATPQPGAAPLTLK